MWGCTLIMENRNPNAIDIEEVVKEVSEEYPDKEPLDPSDARLIVIQAQHMAYGPGVAKTRGHPLKE